MTVTASSPGSAAPVAVGYDDSAPASRALDVAADEAARREAPLVVVVIGGRTWLWAEGSDSSFRDFPLAEQSSTVACARALARISMRHPDLTVELMTVADAVEDRLLRLGRQAQLLVLGHRGQHRLRCLTIGSMSAEIARVFTCPVLIARELGDGESADLRPGGDRGDTGRVVVGLDGTERSNAVMRVALSQAMVTGRPLVAVHAFLGALDPGNRAMARSWATFSRAVVSFGSQVGRSHEFILSQQDPVTALCDQARPADLLVLGTRGHGRLAGLVPAAVSRALLDAMPCDLLIVRWNDATARTEAPPALPALAGQGIGAW